MESLLDNCFLPCGVILASLLMPSCINEGIIGCDSYTGPIEIDCHWNLAPDASPDGMACFFFREDEKATWRFDFPDACGGEVRLPLGDYAFITVNDDTQVVFDNDDSYNLFTISTLPCDLFSSVSFVDNPASDWPKGVDEMVVRCPDLLWCDRIPYVSLGFDKLSYQVLRSGEAYTRSSKFRQLPVHPICIVGRYHVVISDVSGIDGIRHVSAAMSGMSPSVRIHDLSRSSEGATLPFDVSCSDSSMICGDFLSFGRATDSGVRNILYLFVWLSDGSRYNYECDVTSQVIEAGDPMDVWIYIKGIDIPESSETTGGFDVSVDQWNKVVINMNDR